MITTQHIGQLVQSLPRDFELTIEGKLIEIAIDGTAAIECRRSLIGTTGLHGYGKPHTRYYPAAEMETREDAIAREMATATPDDGSIPF